MKISSRQSDLSVIGSTEFVEVAGIKNVPAKIDTGADSSAIHASIVNMEPDGTLDFVLFGEKSPFYTGGHIKTTDYVAKIIRSSNGITQIRYRVELPIKIDSKCFKTVFTLADRSRNKFPVLIGRRAIEGIFLVDVSKSINFSRQTSRSARLNAELSRDPYKFHQKYIVKKED